MLIDQALCTCIDLMLHTINKSATIDSNECNTMLILSAKPNMHHNINYSTYQGIPAYPGIPQCIARNHLNLFRFYLFHIKQNLTVHLFELSKLQNAWKHKFLFEQKYWQPCKNITTFHQQKVEYLLLHFTNREICIMGYVYIEAC